MPELPDVTIYCEHLARRLVGQPLEKIRIASPFLLRSVTPPIREAEGKRVLGVRRLGKRIVLELEADLFLVIHLMIAGRFRWKDRSPAGGFTPPIPGNRKPTAQGGEADRSPAGGFTPPIPGNRKPTAQGGEADRSPAGGFTPPIPGNRKPTAQGGEADRSPAGGFTPPIPGKIGLAAFDFPNGTLMFTEASSKKRASLHLVKGEAGLLEHSRGGLEVLSCSIEQFTEALMRENHTVKRSLTDPRLFSGIGNAYSDEILHRARMSPMKQTHKLAEDEIQTLFEATQATLILWTERLREEAGDDFPENVTAFRDEMAVHGKYKQPCPVCGSKVQRIAYAENETNYCAKCQTGGKLLADRSLSRLLKEDWPKNIDELDR